MNLLGLPIATTKFWFLAIVFLLTAGCQNVQLAPHPIPVRFDGTPPAESTSKPPMPPSTQKTTPKKPKNTNKSRLFYLLENWF